MLHRELDCSLGNKQDIVLVYYLGSCLKVVPQSPPGLFYFVFRNTIFKVRNGIYFLITEPYMNHFSFAAIDFETANYKRNSACAVSIVVVRNNLILNQSTYLIRPPDETFAFTHIHGIRWKDVADKPAFDELWPHIVKYLHELNFVAAHNASFDRSVLSSCCAHYEIASPIIPFICTVELARKSWDIFPTKLPDVCKKLGIALNHHNAASDALACAHIVLRAINDGKFNSLKSICL